MAPARQSALSYSNLEVVDSSNSNLGSKYGLGNGLSNGLNEKEVTFIERFSSVPALLPPPTESKCFDPRYSRTPPELALGHGGCPTQGPGTPRMPTICGLSRKRFLILVTGIVIIILVAVGAGVGVHMASRTSSGRASQESEPTNSTTTPVIPAGTPVSNLSISSLHWTDGDGTDQYRLYHQPENQTSILESAWDSKSQSWAVTTVANGSLQVIRSKTPLAASAGYPNTETKFAIVNNVYFLQSTGTMQEWQNPIHGRTGVWGNENASGLFTASSLSSLFAYWYQDLTAKNQTLVTFFQETTSANSLTISWCFQEREYPQPWKSTRHTLPITPGSPISAAPAGDGRDLRLYVSGPDNLLHQHRYNIETDVLSSTPVSTPFSVPPGTPLCVTTEDNRNFFTQNTRPECTRPEVANAFLTHLILFATPDRESLTLLSWNCSSGFLVQQDRIGHLLKSGRRYVGLTATSGSNGGNGTFTGQRVYVAYEEEGTKGAKVEEWAVPGSGGQGGGEDGAQGGPWRLVGGVPLEAR